MKTFTYNYIKHYKEDSWGFSIFIMEESGNGFARMYQYLDQPNVLYLDMLSVSIDFRNKGLGTELQEVREDFGRLQGCELVMLSVKKDSWMKEWYERRGYQYYSDGEDNLIWMEKSLLI